MKKDMASKDPPPFIYGGNLKYSNTESSSKPVEYVKSSHENTSKQEIKIQQIPQTQQPIAAPSYQENYFAQQNQMAPQVQDNQPQGNQMGQHAQNIQQFQNADSYYKFNESNFQQPNQASYQGSYQNSSNSRNVKVIDSFYYQEVKNLIKKNHWILEGYSLDDPDTLAQDISVRIQQREDELKINELFDSIITKKIALLKSIELNNSMPIPMGRF